MHPLTKGNAPIQLEITTRCRAFNPAHRFPGDALREIPGKIEGKSWKPYSVKSEICLAGHLDFLCFVLQN